MKKFLSIFAALLCAGITFADQVTLDFTSAEGLAALGVTPAVVEEGASKGIGVDFTTATVGNLTITADKGTGSTAPCVFTSKDQSTDFRVYKGNTLTFTGKGEKDIITEIEFDGTSLKFAELTDKKWTGEKHSVTINTTDDTGARNVRKIIVTLTEGEEGQGGEGGEGGEGVKDKVTLTWDKAIALREQGQWKLTLSDSKSTDHADLLFLSEKENGLVGSYTLEAGTDVVYKAQTEALVSGSLKLAFKKVEMDDNIYTIEAAFVTEKAEFTLKQDIRVFAWDGEFPILLAADRPFGRVLTCAEARAFALSLADKTESAENIVVEGFITDVFSDKKSFWIDDVEGSTKTFEIYLFSSLKPAGAAITKGLKVRATGKAQNYNGTPEIKNGSVEIISGTAVDNVRSEATAVKFIENGQLYILRSGVRYNVQGQVVK